MASEIFHQPLARLAAMLGAGELSSVELMQAVADRCLDVEPRVQAFNSRDEAGALAQAAESDRRRSRGAVLDRSTGFRSGSRM